MAVVLFCAVAAAAIAQDEAPALAVDMTGRFVGYAYVGGADGEVKTDLRMSIEKAGDGAFRVELSYLSDKTARFSAARPAGSRVIAFSEAVRLGQEGRARAEGRLNTRDGERVSGTVRVYAGDSGAERLVQTVRIFAERLQTRGGEEP
ncbi:hypothetical protein K8I61_13440 [bacterium]|nr:hypothetical protein [bacterium]